jgi:hypothetical protein
LPGAAHLQRRGWREASGEFKQGTSHFLANQAPKARSTMRQSEGSGLLPRRAWRGAAFSVMVSKKSFE